MLLPGLNEDIAILFLIKVWEKKDVKIIKKLWVLFNLYFGDLILDLFFKNILLGLLILGLKVISYFVLFCYFIILNVIVNWLFIIWPNKISLFNIYILPLFLIFHTNWSTFIGQKFKLIFKIWFNKKFVLSIRPHKIGS